MPLPPDHEQDAAPVAPPAAPPSPRQPIGPAGDLLPVVYAELRRLAGACFRRERGNHTLQPTALVHEAFIKLYDQTQADWKDRGHFLVIAARAMRQILVNHALARAALKRGGGRVRLGLTEGLAAAPQAEFDAIALDEALKRLSALDERKGRVVELRFFGGLTIAQTAESLGVGPTTVEDDWAFARSWLRRALRDADSEE